MNRNFSSERYQLVQSVLNAHDGQDRIDLQRFADAAKLRVIGRVIDRALRGASAADQSDAAFTKRMLTANAAESLANFIRSKHTEDGQRTIKLMRKSIQAYYDAQRP